MKKGKITVGITVAIACFALMTVMFMQFKIVNETDITSIETMREEELELNLQIGNKNIQKRKNNMIRKNQN